MVRNLLSPIVIRDGTPIEDVVKESRTMFGRLPTQDANHAATYVTQLLTHLDVSRLQAKGAVRPGPEPKPKPKPNPSHKRPMYGCLGNLGQCAFKPQAISEPPISSSKIKGLLSTG